MPPTPFAPGVLQSVISGTVGPQNYALVWHWQWGTSTSPWTATNAQEVAQSIWDNFKTHMREDLSGLCNTVSCTTVDLTNSTPATGVSTGAAYTGLSTGNPPTLAASTLIQFKIASRYRGGKPRTYLPGGRASLTTDGDNWDPAFVTQVATDFIAFVSAVHSATYTSPPSGGLQHVAPRYGYTYVDDPLHHKYKKEKTSFLGSFQVLEYNVIGSICSQRRRLGRAP